MITPHFRVGSLIKLLHYCDFNNRAVMSTALLKQISDELIQLPVEFRPAFF